MTNIQNTVDFMTKYYPINQEGANKATEDLTKLILSSSTTANTKWTHKTKQQPMKKHKPGYDNECSTIKRNLNHLSKLLHKYPNDPFIRSSLLKSKKQYKKLVKHKQKQYKEGIMYQIENA